MIQETGIFRLLMLPAAIESHFLHQADVSDKILIRGGSQYSVAPIPLIQHELEIVSSVGSAGGVSINSGQGATAYRELVKYCVMVIVTAPFLCIYPFLQ